MKKFSPLGVGLGLLVSLSCSQIVGITDTDVTRGAGGTDPATGGSTSPGTSGKNGVAGGQGNGAGTANGGSGGTDTTSQAGATSGAGMSMGGTATGGTATGGTATGGTATGGTATGGAGGSHAGVGGGGSGGGGSGSGGGGSGSGGGGSGSGGGGSGGGGGASVLHGPTLIDTGAYSVDATEVTVAQYKEFLAAKAGNTGGQIAACTWNTAFYDVPTPLENNTWPIANVDWCDATAFCSWAGKRLCGAIGGGAVSIANFMDATKSQWFRACGGGGTHPNGSPVCNNTSGAESIAPVKSYPGCEGFDKGVFDMQGNVAEWVDSCDGSTGKTDHCLLAGGSELDNISYCTESFEDITRDSTSPYFGFRCCSK